MPRPQSARRLPLSGGSFPCIPFAPTVDPHSLLASTLRCYGVGHSFSPSCDPRLASSFPRKRRGAPRACPPAQVPLFREAAGATAPLRVAGGKNATRAGQARIQEGGGRRARAGAGRGGRGGHAGGDHPTERWRRIIEDKCILIDDAPPPEALGPKGSHKTWRRPPQLTNGHRVTA